MIRKQRGWAWLPAAIGAVASIWGGNQSRKSQEQANDQSIELANTAMQRRVEDLQKAGLNPMLAYSQGGAQSPQITNAVGAGVSSAQQGGALGEGLANVAVRSLTTNNIKADTELKEAQADKARTEAEVAMNSMVMEELRLRAVSAKAQAEAGYASPMLEAQLNKLREEGSSARSHALREAGSFEADVRRRKAEATLSELDIPRMKGEAGFFDNVGSMPKWLQMIMGVLQAGHGMRNWK